MFFNPFENRENRVEYTTTQNRVASKLQSPPLLYCYHTTDLYADLDELGFRPSLTRDNVNGLITSISGLIDAPDRIRDALNPFYAMQQKRMMALNLGRYALEVDDLLTAYYSAEYSQRIPSMTTDASADMIKYVVGTWDSWMKQIVNE